MPSYQNVVTHFIGVLPPHQQPDELHTNGYDLLQEVFGEGSDGAVHPVHKE